MVLYSISNDMQCRSISAYKKSKNHPVIEAAFDYFAFTFYRNRNYKYRLLLCVRGRMLDKFSCIYKKLSIKFDPAKVGDNYTSQYAKTMLDRTVDE